MKHAYLSCMIFAMFVMSAVATLSVCSSETGGKVTITTDKTAYRKGEAITITVRNELNQSIWFFDAERGGRNPWWGIRRLEDGHWIQLEIWKTTKDKCVVIVSEHVPIEELVKKLRPSLEINDQWTLKNCVVSSPVGPEIELDFVESGTYQLFFKYGFDRSYRGKTVYSKTFKIGGE